LSLKRSPIFLDKKFESCYSQFIVEKNDILISMTGTLGKRDYGYSILYNENFPSLLNQRVGRIRLSSDCINLSFLMYTLLSEPFLLQLFSKPSGTKQGNLSSDDIIGNYFGLPELEEQKQIVEYLDEQTGLIDKTISNEEKRIELLKEYRQSLISEVVTGKRKVTN
jgi:type I restriction enzyme S subunit